MPYLNLRLVAEESAELTKSIVSSLMTHTHDILAKKSELTAIDIQFNKPERWFINGMPVSETQQTTFYLDIKITEGSNTKQQKASYIQAVFYDLQKILGPLAQASYIVIHELRADAWGFQERTQESRFIESQSL